MKTHRKINSLLHIRHKLKIALLFMVLLGLELFSSFSEDQNSDEMQNTLETIYNDRLRAQDLIYKMENNTYRRKIEFLDDARLPLPDSCEKQQAQLESLIAEFQKTRLTRDEEKTLATFKELNANLVAIEDQAMKDAPLSETLLAEHDKTTEALLTELQKLSDIQIVEGKNLHSHSKRTFAYASVLSQFNWVVIVVIGLTIISLVFASKSTRPEFEQQARLN